MKQHGISSHLFKQFILFRHDEFTKEIMRMEGLADKLAQISTIETN